MAEEASYILALDQGTTSSRAILFDHSGAPQWSAQREFLQIYPAPGLVEHDPEEVWRTQITVAHEAITRSGVSISQIAAIGITNQRETTVLWDRATGQPLHNAIVWQDRRTSGFCDELRARGLAEMVRSRTGLVIDAYFSSTKLAWLLQHIPQAPERAARGEILFGTIDSFLLWRLTGGTVHRTDYSNASRTGLFNIHTLQWDDDILRELDIPRSLLPEVCPSSYHFGETAHEIFGRAIPITGIAGDQQAATFGQACFTPGTVKNTYGTGSFMLMNTGDEAKESSHGLLTTIAWGIEGRVTYALEGSIFITGAAIQWLRDEMHIINSAEESEMVAGMVEDSGGVYFVPAFAGLGAPYWDPYARGLLIGLTRGTNRAHITRAVLEAACYQTRDVLEVMRDDTALQITELRVDGGMVSNNLLMQLQADIAGVRVVRPTVAETTARGAAYLAGLAVGYWADQDRIATTWQQERLFEPAVDGGGDEGYRRWKHAVERSRGWLSED